MRIFCAATLFLFWIAGSASAVDFDYIKIADQSTVPPITGGPFTSFDAPVVDGSNVVFVAANAGNQAVISNRGGTLSRVADTATLIPGTAGSAFTFFHSVSVNKSTVAFVGNGMASQGVYKSDAGSLSRVADLSTSVPPYGTLNSFSGTAISGSSVVYGAFASTYGIFKSGPAVQIIANGATPVPPSNAFNFGIVSTPSASGDTIAFAGAGPVSGVYAFDGSVLREVASSNTTLPDSMETFGFVVAPSVSNGSIAVRNASMGPGGTNGIYVDAGGTLSTVVDSHTAVPGSVGNFTNFFGHSLNNDNVAFIGFYNAGDDTGLFTNLGGSLTPVAKKNMILDGGVISDFPQGLSSQAMSNGNIAFTVRFTDNRRAVYAALSNYVYSADASGTWDDASNWSMSQKPRAVVGTVIHTTNGAIILGPATSTTVRTLDLDSSNSGVAELRLQPTGQLTVNEYLYVQTRGKLNLNGGAVTSHIGMYNYGIVDLAGGQTNGGFLSNIGVLHGSGAVGNFVINYGRIEAINAQQRYQASVDNSFILDVNDQPIYTGKIDIRNSLVDFAGGLQNHGQVNFSSGASDVFGSVQNLAANGPEPGGQIIVSGNSSVTFYNQVTHNGTLFRVSPGSTAIFFGPVSGAGAFTGTGTKIFEGGFSPGNSPAAVALEGSVQFTATNTLKIELGGTAVGTQYDKVSVNGAVTLGGTLDLKLLAPFQPALGNTFDILDWTTRTGGFTSVQFPPLAANLAWNAMQLYPAGVVSVVDINLLPGDFNRDQQVTAADIPAMLKALTNIATYQTEKSLTDPQLIAIGDLNLSGTVTNLDFQLLLNIVPTLAGNGSLAAVPEPSAVVLFAIGCAGFAIAFRRGARLRGSRNSSTYASFFFELLSNGSRTHCWTSHGQTQQWHPTVAKPLRKSIIRLTSRT